MGCGYALLLPFFLAACVVQPCDDVLEQNRQTLEWLKNKAWTPDCVTEPWPQCMH